MYTPELVILGGPNSGKTHYAGQLYGRLQRNPGILRLRNKQGTPTNISALEEVLRCLENGNAAEHTSANSWSEVLLPLCDDNGNDIDLRWPDYGGEQIQAVFTTRQVPESWQEKLKKAEGWVLLIRLNAETTYDDAINSLTFQKTNHIENNVRVKTWDANARWVELLQILLHVAEQGISQPLVAPRLAVLLSCYDEVSVEDSKPSDVLEKKLPLLSSFIKSNWRESSVTIWGLSALGRNLSKESADNEFIDAGPEHHGWIVSPEGGKPSPDITLPIQWLLNND